MKKQLIFQLGTDSWQRLGELASGSGVIHEAHHNAFNAIPNIAAYSAYPSATLSFTDPQVSVLALPHDAPAYGSDTTGSPFHYHGLSSAEFEICKQRLKASTARALESAEEREGTQVDLAIAHHSFINLIILSELNAERVALGKNRFKLMYFANGKALKMFAHEMRSVNTEYPSGFYPLLKQSGLFAKNSPVDLYAATSKEQLAVFSSIFPDFETQRMLVTHNGYAADCFKPNLAVRERKESISDALVVPKGPLEISPTEMGQVKEKVVVFCGNFGDWKRLDLLLQAASIYERRANITTLIIGSGSREATGYYHRLAFQQLGLLDTWFLGAKKQPDIARINALADVGVYPSLNESSGLIFKEAMACGTPVIGSDSGLPRSFVSDAVGALVPESDPKLFVPMLAKVVLKALDEDWKTHKGPVAAAYAASSYSLKRQCEQLLGRVLATGQYQHAIAGSTPISETAPQPRYSTGSVRRLATSNQP